MITIDIDAKIEAIKPRTLATGMTCVFELRDANNLDTVVHLTFYKKQMDYILKQIYDVDRKKMRRDLRAEFVRREEGKMGELHKELSGVRMELALIKEEAEQDASTTDK